MRHMALHCATWRCLIITQLPKVAPPLEIPGWLEINEGGHWQGPRSQADHLLLIQALQEL